MKTFEAIKDGANFLGEEMDITSIAVRFYSALYRFAVSLTRSETDAADLVQETFLALTQRSHQIRDFSQIKSWLFTTLRREFLRTIRRRKIHYEVEFLPDIHNLPASDLAPWRSLDARIVLDALLQVDEPYQAKRIQRAFFSERCERSYTLSVDHQWVPVCSVAVALAGSYWMVERIVQN